MHLTFNTFLIFLSTSLMVFALAMLIYDKWFHYRLAVRERVTELSTKTSAASAISLFKDIKRLQSSELTERETWNEKLQRLIDQAGIQCSTPVLFAWSAGLAFVLASASAWRVWWLGVALAPVGAVLPLMVLLWCRRRRQRKLCHQLPEAFAMISRAVRAGQTVPAALQIIANDFEPPISAEFTLCYEQQNLGMSRESALRKLAMRGGIMELQIFVVALLVQAKSGGDLVELLDNLAAMIRKRLKLKDRVRALTGEGRMQALVLMVLPVAALLLTIVLSPQYAKELLDRPYLLGGTAVAQAAGAFWIRRIVSFEY